MNIAILLGRLTRDPELRTTQSGLSVATFTIAIDRKFKNADGTRTADFISCVAWRQTAEFIAQYFHKGSMIAVEGTIQTRNYEAQDGSGKRYVTEVIVDAAHFTGNKQDNQSGYQTEQYDGDSSVELPFEL